MASFDVLQQAFADHLRDPQKVPFEQGIEQRRLNVYRELFFNNVKGFLDNGFPVLASLYSDEQWASLARQFFAQHPCRSPYFVEISKEFVEFLSNEYQPQDSDPPFMTELAHYEWLELDVSIRRTEQTVSPWQGGELPDQVQASPLATLVSYAFAVHRIGPEYQPQSPDGPHYLVVYRDDNDDVGFSLLNPVSAQLFSVIQANPGIDLKTLATTMAGQLPQVPAEQVRQGLLQTTQQMLSAQILLPG
ncbi:putative DNA-binding domain-containing protein [Aestuariibacter halophilus]|uniref:DNA-binding domain-containing protein n=1 Tax=Fluctibacter halophilus TaxID=226011 RepID=A0ABS8G738_9ALTE|nr:putative DNA-binding domain-containing protein [Aestuariibacter halophilus]MCC2616328.1 putative DNA-binding domain-containing protein [Aestuariibacter halophilus]